MKSNSMFLRDGKYSKQKATQNSEKTCNPCYEKSCEVSGHLQAFLNSEGFVTYLQVVLSAGKLATGVTCGSVSPYLSAGKLSTGVTCGSVSPCLSVGNGSRAVKC